MLAEVSRLRPVERGSGTAGKAEGLKLNVDFEADTYFTPIKTIGSPYSPRYELVDAIRKFVV